MAVLEKQKAQDKVVEVKEPADVAFLDRTLETYDFDKFVPVREWWLGSERDSAVGIVGHNRICALHTVGGRSYMDNSIKAHGTHRAQLGVKDKAGNLINPKKALTDEQMMMLDMDYLMSAITSHEGPPSTTQSKQPISIELFTNTTESPRWLAFLKRCPYARKVYTIPSKMGKYDVCCWIISKVAT